MRSTGSGTEIRLGDILRLKKPHPCGESRWEVVRVGHDIGLRCLGCDRFLIMPRSRLAKKIREKLTLP